MSRYGDDANPVGWTVLVRASCLWTNNGHPLYEDPDQWAHDMYEPM